MEHFRQSAIVITLCSLCLMVSNVVAVNDEDHQVGYSKLELFHVLQALKQMDNAENVAFWTLLNPTERRDLLSAILRQNYEIKKSTSSNTNGNPNGSSMMCHFKICNLGRRRRLKESVETPPETRPANDIFADIV